MACKGHSKGGHSGAPKAKPKQKAGKACSIKLQREKKNVKAANKYLKKLFGKK
jgi:hypothetical protein